MKYVNYKNKENFRLLLELTVIWFLYSYLFNKFQYKIGVVFSIIYLIYFIFSNKEKKYYLILFALPFASIFKISNSLPSTLIILYLIYIFESFIYNKRIIINFDKLIALTVLIITQILAIIFYNENIISVLSFIVNIIFMLMCIENFKRLSAEKKCLLLNKSSLVFAVSICISIIVADLFPEIPYLVLREKQTILMSINRFCGLNGDPNYYSQLILMSIALLFGTIRYERSRIYKILKILVAIFLFINGFRSISKSYAITMVILLVLIFSYEFKYLITKKSLSYLKLILIFLIVIVFFFLLCFFINYSIIPLIESRTDAGDFFTGRTNIWNEYIQILKVKTELIILGVGFSNEAYILQMYFGHAKAAHNIYIEILFGIGIVGIVALSIIIKEIIINIKIILKNESSLYIIMFLITGLGLSLSSNDVIYILLPVSVLMIKNNKEGLY